MYRVLLAVAVVSGLVLTLVMAEQDTDVPTSEEGQAESTPDCVYVGTPHDVIDKMLETASIRQGDLVYDLGCGDGRIVVAAARRHGCRGLGYDINPVRVDEARKNVDKHRVGRLVEIRQDDIFEVDLRPCNVVMLYLLPEMNLRLLPQLEKLKPGSRVVTHDYSIEGVVADRVIEMDSLEDGVKHYIYLFKAPLTKEDQ